MSRMKTIQQLLQLVNNPYYKMTEEEKEVVNDFLSSRVKTQSKKYQKKTSSELSEKTRVTVRNIVAKTNTYAPEAVEGPLIDFVS